MKYPFWLPKPRRHWLRAIELLFLSIPVVFILIGIYRIGVTVSLPMLVLGEAQLTIWIVLWLGLLLLFPPYFFAHIYQFLHDDPRDDFPVWFPRWRCWINGFAYWIIALLAIFITLVSWLGPQGLLLEGNTPKVQRYIREITPWLNITWIAVAAYLFYLKDGIKWFCQELVKLAFALVGKKR